MTNIRSIALVAAAAVSVISLSACSSESADTPAPTTAEAQDPQANEAHGGHNHPEDGGPAPEGIEEAAAPKFPVGTEVILTADHMPGMEGAPATISGAYNTYTYAVTYTPTDGGEQVVNHKWVVQEELEGAGTQRLADGATAVILAEHMSGMKGAEATIESSTDETVYMVDIDTPDMTMKRHKWVVESEIQPK